MTPAVNSLPLVSVVLPAYNGTAYLTEQLQSLEAQTYPHVEYVLIDDASTDDTPALLQAWKEKSRHPVQVHLNEKNRGYNANFERGMQLATGELIAFCDQDDRWLPEKLSRLVPLFADPRVMVAHCRSIKWDGGEGLREGEARLRTLFDGDDPRRLLFFNQLNGHNMVFRAALVPLALPLPGGMMYDWWMAVAGAAQGRIAGLDEVLVWHRRHANNSYFSATAKKSGPDMPELLAHFRRLLPAGTPERSFLEALIERLEAHTGQGFDRDLFRFLLQHRQIIFGHKRRAFPLLSHLKHAYRYARLDYRGAGIV